MNGYPGCPPAISLNSMRGSIGIGDMNEDEEGLRQPAAEANTSQRWGNPPLWSPWNFQSPKPDRERQTHGYRIAHASTHARDEKK